MDGQPKSPNTAPGHPVRPRIVDRGPIEFHTRGGNAGDQTEDFENIVWSMDGFDEHE